MRRSFKHTTLGYTDQTSAESKDAYAWELSLGSKKNNMYVNAVHHANDSKKLPEILCKTLKCATVAFTKLLPFNGYLSFGKSQKSQEAKSEL